MQKYIVPRALFALVLFGIVLLVVACGGDTPTSTPVPPTVNVPTPLPPAPTAPPLTEVPTAVLPTNTPLPTATAVVPPTEAATEAATLAATAAATAAATNTTASSAVAATSVATRSIPASQPTSNIDRGALNGLYVSNLRFEPDYPVNNDPVRFYATIINQTGKDQHYPVCVEIYRPDAPKPFGTSSCDVSTIVPNTSEVLAGYWTGSGIKECIPVRARPILKEEGEGEARLVFTTLNSGEVWVDFSVCP